MSESLTNFLNWYRQTNPNKSQATYDAMKYNLSRICKLNDCEFADLNVETHLTNPEEIIKVIREKYSLNTSIQTILGIKFFLLFKGNNYSLIKNYETLLKQLTEENQKIIEKNELTEKERINWIDYPNLRERMAQVWDYGIAPSSLEMDFHIVRNITMVAMYVFLPPARIGNYSKMVLRYVKKHPIKVDTQTNSYPKKHNYLFLTEAGALCLVFNQYKTSKYVGQKCLTITPDMGSSPFGDMRFIYKILFIYIRRREAFFGNKKTQYKKINPLFFNIQTKKEIDGSHFTDILKETTSKYVGKTLSVNLFRHIFITDFLKKETDIHYKRMVAEFMGQTYTPTMLEKYNRVNIKENQLINGGEEVSATSSGAVLHFD